MVELIYAFMWVLTAYTMALGIIFGKMYPTDDAPERLIYLASIVGYTLLIAGLGAIIL